MTRNLFRMAGFTIKGTLAGFSLGLGGAVFGTLIGSSFQSIWESGMPLAMGAMGAVIFSILAGIGLHNPGAVEYQDHHVHNGK